MARKTDDENRRAAEVNPSKSGIRTGNPQLEPHEGGTVRAAAHAASARHHADRAGRAPRQLTVPGDGRGD